MMGKKIALTMVIPALATTILGITAAPAAADAVLATTVVSATLPANPAAAATSPDDAAIQSLHYVCAQDLRLRDRPGGETIGWLYYGDYVDYSHSIPGWSYVWSYKHGYPGWIQSGWLSPC